MNSMDEAEIKSVAPDEVNELQARYDALSHLVTSILVLMVVVSGTLAVYLLRQWRMTSKDLAGYRPAATQFIAEYNRLQGPRTDAFLEKLKDFGRVHQDYFQILARYGMTTNVLAASQPPAAKAPPAAAPKQ